MAFCTYWASSEVVARQLHLLYARRPPATVSKSLPAFFVCLFFKNGGFSKLMKSMVFKSAHFCSQFCANSLAEVGAWQLFFALFSGTLWTPLRPGPAAARCPAEPDASRSLLPDPALPGLGSGPWTPGHWNFVRGHHGLGDGAPAPGLELF